MKTEPSYNHPIDLYPQKIRDEGIVVFDDVRGLPTLEDPFVSPDYAICIGHRGRINLLYDGMPDTFDKLAVGFIFPNHKLEMVEKTEDYLSTLIVVAGTMKNDPMLQIINNMRYSYEPHPCVKLDRHEYKMIMNVVEGMREIVRLNMPERLMLMTRLLEFLIRLLSQYRKLKLNETIVGKRVSMMFQNELVQHFREHRDVGYYAEKACLSTKHFSAVIKQETGHTAAHWIHKRIVAEAKMMLHLRHDLSVQAIADMLGFDEQSTFSRYFRRETGLSPTEFRERN